MLRYRRLLSAQTVVIAACLVLAAHTDANAADEALFTYKGKTYKTSDLTSAQQQALYDLELDGYVRREGLAEQAIYDLYVAEEAKKSGETPKQVEDRLLKVKEPSDKEVATWFESNKGRLPPGYKLEQISGDIKNLLKGEGLKKERDALMARLKKDGNLSLAVSEPVAPVVQIDTAGYPKMGKDGAKAIIVEFADYQCPHCKHTSADLHKLAKSRDDVQVIYMDFPIKGAVSNAIAYGAFCADQQGKFWEYNALAFAKQGTLGEDAAKVLAKELKLDEGKLDSCLRSGEAEKRVAKARAEGERIGISGTPTLFLNGKRMKGFEADELKAAIDRAVGKSSH